MKLDMADWHADGARELFHAIGSGVYLLATVLGLSAVDRGFSRATLLPTAMFVAYVLLWLSRRFFVASDSAGYSKMWFLPLAEIISVTVVYTTASVLMGERTDWTRRRCGYCPVAETQAYRRLQRARSTSSDVDVGNPMASPPSPAVGIEPQM